MKLQETLYQTIRTEFGLKAQFTISAFKTVNARYKTVQEQLFQKPYRYENEIRKEIVIIIVMDIKGGRRNDTYTA